MKKKIIVGSLRQETNSFSQVKTMEKDFTVVWRVLILRILKDPCFQ